MWWPVAQWKEVVDTAVGINLAKPSVFQESNKLPGGQSVEYRLLSIP